jgi:hypothetical protein
MAAAASVEWRAATKAVRLRSECSGESASPGDPRRSRVAARPGEPLRSRGDWDLSGEA